MSRLLFLVAELYSEGKIEQTKKHMLKELIFREDTNLITAAAHYDNSDDLKNQLLTYAERVQELIKTEEGKQAYKSTEIKKFSGKLSEK